MGLVFNTAGSQARLCAGALDAPARLGDEDSNLDKQIQSLLSCH